MPGLGVWAHWGKSSLGVLEDTKMDVVPGTAPLEDRDELNVARRTADSNVKYSKSGIILVPQPSDDPRDPLNLPLWRRDLITGILCLWSVIASTLSPLLAASSIELLFFYRPTRSFTQIALLTGWHLLGVGIAAFIFVPLARIWGKRHIYLIGTFLIVISSAWGGGSGQNYDSLVAARFFQGVGLAPFESLVNASVADLYFVHERGLRMAISNLCLFGGAFFTPVIVGVIGYNPSLRWPWTFYFVAIFGAILLPFMVLFVPETTFNRGEAVPVQTAVLVPSKYANEEYTSKEATSSSSQSSQTEQPTVVSQAAPTSTAVPALLSMHNLRVFHGRFTDAPFWKLLLRPLPLFFHPAVFWAMLIQGTIIGWTVFIGIILAAVFYAPPINKSEKEIGFLYTGAFIGALVGFAIAGALSWVPIWMAKRNKGIFEPEFRLVLVIPMLIFGCAGLYGWGYTSANILKYGVIIPDAFFGLEVVGMVIGAVASALYLVDAHKDITVEAFTCLIVFKNIFSFALCFKGYDWLRTSDITVPFIAIGSVQAGICALTIPMYIFGKWNRSFFARHDILKLCGLDHTPGPRYGPKATPS